MWTRHDIRLSLSRSMNESSCALLVFAVAYGFFDLTESTGSTFSLSGLTRSSSSLSLSALDEVVAARSTRRHKDHRDSALSVPPHSQYCGASYPHQERTPAPYRAAVSFGERVLLRRPSTQKEPPVRAAFRIGGRERSVHLRSSTRTDEPITSVRESLIEAQSSPHLERQLPPRTPRWRPRAAR